MTRRPRVTSAAAIALGVAALVQVQVAAASVPLPDLVTNGGADVGDTRGWAGRGFEPLLYGASSEVPSEVFATWDWRTPPPEPLRSRLFVGAPSATLEQRVDLQAFATAIDGGDQWFTLRAWLGGSGGSDAGVVMTLVFMDADGQPLGSDESGPPSAADRLGESTLLSCQVAARAPARTRSAAITLTTVGSSRGVGLADSIALLPGLHPQQDRPYGPLVRTSPGCTRPGPLLPATVAVGGLTRRSLELQVSGRARLVVRIRRPSRSGWSLVERQARRVRQASRLRMPLPVRLVDGRYRVVVTARKPGAHSSTTRVVRMISR